ncbi:MAG TPA: hypothetical protein VJ183_09520 [Chloroflexia bacterium]|nr:hypothetical protein [Chloroflexia bacterium]
MKHPNPKSEIRNPKSPTGLIRASMLYLFSASTGARIAIDEDIRGQFLGRCSEKMPQEDFVRGMGTALSPGVKMLVAQMAATALAGRQGFLGNVGVAALTLLGAAATVGMLGEAVTYQVLNPRTFDPPKAIIVTGNIIFPIIMVLLGARELGRERR